MNWPFGSLATFGYDVIDVDPPTPFRLYSEAGNAKSASAHYQTMTWTELAALPVGHLARSNAILLLWTFAPVLPESLALMAQWGATYKSNLVWRKITANGKVRTGPGYRVRTQHEHILLGVFGDERQIHKPFPSIIDGIAREHSRKPDEYYRTVIDRTPGLERCSLFARETRDGFASWGNEATKFDQEIVA